jgi:hypothetical protein
MTSLLLISRTDKIRVFLSTQDAKCRGGSYEFVAKRWFDEVEFLAEGGLGF